MISSNYCYLMTIIIKVIITTIICLYTVIWLEVVLSNANNFLNRSILSIEVNLTGTTIPGQSRPESDGKGSRT